MPGTIPVTHPQTTNTERIPVIGDGIGEEQQNENFHESVALLAYAIWQDRGCPPGTDVEDWLEAEQQLSRRHVASTA
ncbi:MAG TPA: DUF2934 domain-containing protein [Bryobacteraceae bacterium]